MIVNVTEADIKKGRRRSPCGCPIALAVKRAYKAPLVATCDTYIALVPDNASVRWHTPPEAITFIHTFDNTGKGAPFTFELSEPYQGTWPTQETL